MGFPKRKSRIKIHVPTKLAKIPTKIPKVTSWKKEIRGMCIVMMSAD